MWPNSYSHARQSANIHRVAPVNLYSSHLAGSVVETTSGACANTENVSVKTLALGENFLAKKNILK